MHLKNSHIGHFLHGDEVRVPTHQRVCGYVHTPASIIVICYYIFFFFFLLNDLLLYLIHWILFNIYLASSQNKQTYLVSNKKKKEKIEFLCFPAFSADKLFHWENKANNNSHTNYFTNYWCNERLLVNEKWY